MEISLENFGERVKRVSHNVTLDLKHRKKKQRKRKPIAISHFQVTKITFKTRLSAKISFMYMRVKNHFNVKWLYSWSRFETKGWGTPEIAFWSMVSKNQLPLLQQIAR